ncbi:MAG: hypothetical protein RI601_02120 [Desulfurivibrionaceae bacterium]|nr:hypothetical protein [Desulfurivibrionaceae bacterium]
MVILLFVLYFKICITIGGNLSISFSLTIDIVVKRDCAKKKRQPPFLPANTTNKTDTDKLSYSRGLADIQSNKQRGEQDSKRFLSGRCSCLSPIPGKQFDEWRSIPAHSFICDLIKQKPDTFTSSLFQVPGPAFALFPLSLCGFVLHTLLAMAAGPVNRGNQKAKCPAGTLTIHNQLIQQQTTRAPSVSILVVLWFTIWIPRILLAYSIVILDDKV